MFGTKPRLRFIPITLALCVAIFAQSSTLAATRPSPKAGTKSPAAKKVSSRLEELGSNPNPSCGLNVDPKRYSSTIIDSYPAELAGIWGGELKIFSNSITPEFYKRDPLLAKRTQLLLMPGRTCALNFDFQMEGDKLMLQPVSGVVSVPIKSTNTYAAMLKAGKVTPAIANMMIPALVLYFGTVKSNADEKGVSGGDFNNTALKKITRMISSDTFEEQSFVKQVVSFGGSRVLKGTDENVFWFKIVPRNNTLYVRLIGLTFDEKGKLLSKLVLTGSLDKGREQRDVWGKYKKKRDPIKENEAEPSAAPASQTDTQMDAPKNDAPKSEDPQSEAPKDESPKIENPKSEAPNDATPSLSP